MGPCKRMCRMGIVFPLVLLVLNTIYLFAAFDIRTQFGGGEAVGPRTIPILASIGMYVALAIVLFSEWRKQEDAQSREAFGRPVLVAVLTAVYIALFSWLGYWVDTALFVAALFVVFKFELKRPVFFAAYLVGVTIIFYVLFALIFSVRLPQLPGGIG